MLMVIMVMVITMIMMIVMMMLTMDIRIFKDSNGDGNDIIHQHHG